MMNVKGTKYQNEQETNENESRWWKPGETDEVMCP